MKTLAKILVTVLFVVAGMITVIKFVQGCSWKDAIGIFEEFVNEMKESCRRRCRSAVVEETQEGI